MARLISETAAALFERATATDRALAGEIIPCPAIIVAEAKETMNPPNDDTGETVGELIREMIADGSLARVLAREFGAELRGTTAEQRP